MRAARRSRRSAICTTSCARTRASPPNLRPENWRGCSSSWAIKAPPRPSSIARSARCKGAPASGRKSSALGKIMPMIDADGCPIHDQVAGPERAPVLMLSNSLATTLDMWSPQVEPFTRQFRLVRYDRRGHGKSGVPKGPYTMERLGRDALAILDALELERVNWCGLSMGGMVGQWLGANAPQRVERLVITNTSSYFVDKTSW